ncbi:MAG: hypothetical protein NVS2B14_00010 [Chamaesiphon sp.]
MNQPANLTLEDELNLIKFEKSVQQMSTEAIKEQLMALHKYIIFQQIQANQAIKKAWRI